MNTYMRTRRAHTRVNRSLLHLYCSLSLRTYKLYDAAETIQSWTRASVFFFFPFCDEQSNKFNKELIELAAVRLMIPRFCSVSAGGEEGSACSPGDNLKSNLNFL